MLIIKFLALPQTPFPALFPPELALSLTSCKVPSISLLLSEPQLSLP